MMLLKRPYLMNWLKKLMPLVLVDLLKKQLMSDETDEIKAKIRNNTGLATTNEVNGVKYKIPNISTLVKETDLMQKYQALRKKDFSSSDCNKFTNEIHDAKIKDKIFVNKSDISEFKNNCYLDKKIETFVAKRELKAEQDKLVKPQTYVSSLFISMMDHKIS